MNIDNVKEKISVVQLELQKLEQKKSDIEKKIKSKQELIDGYALQISQLEMNELKQSLEDNGTSLNEVLQALKNGDLSKIQSKLNPKCS